jgi:hypothetical protein
LKYRTGVSGSSAGFSPPRPVLARVILCLIATGRCKKILNGKVEDFFPGFNKVKGESGKMEFKISNSLKQGVASGCPIHGAKQNREPERAQRMSSHETALARGDGRHSTVLCSDDGCDRDADMGPCPCSHHENEVPPPPDPFRALRPKAHSLVLCAANSNCQKCDCKCHEVAGIHTSAKREVEEIDDVPLPPSTRQMFRR